MLGSATADEGDPERGRSAGAASISSEEGILILGKGKRRELEEQLKEKAVRLKKLRERLQAKDHEIEALRSRLEQLQGAAASLGQEGPPPFFLVGRAKSGTSWLMRIFNYHPEVLCRGEGRIFGRDYKNEHIKQMDSKTIQPSSLYRAILDAEYLNAWVERSVWSRDEDKDEHLRGLTRAAAEYFLKTKLARSGKKIVGDKTPFLGDDLVEEVHEIYPEAKIIHIVRDGRDVAISSIHHTWNRVRQEGGTYDLSPKDLARRDAYRADPRAFGSNGESIFVEGLLAGIARDWARVISRTRRDGPALLGENYAEVRYEDLLERPEEEVARLLRFVGADAGEEVAKRCVEKASFERWTDGRKRGEEDPTAFLRKGVAGDWKNVFTREDREVFKKEAGDLLVALGYEKDHGW